MNEGEMPAEEDADAPLSDEAAGTAGRGWGGGRGQGRGARRQRRAGAGAGVLRGPSETWSCWRTRENKCPNPRIRGFDVVAVPADRAR